MPNGVIVRRNRLGLARNPIKESRCRGFQRILEQRLDQTCLPAAVQLFLEPGVVVLEVFESPAMRSTHVLAHPMFGAGLKILQFLAREEPGDDDTAVTEKIPLYLIYVSSLISGSHGLRPPVNKHSILSPVAADTDLSRGNFTQI